MGFGSPRILFRNPFRMRVRSCGTPMMTVAPLSFTADKRSGPFRLAGYIIDPPRKAGTRKVHIKA